MFCPKCGTQASDDAAFCQKCGAKLITGDAEQQAATPTPVRQPQNVSSDTPKKKKSKKLPIILAAIGLVFVVILIAANSGELQERGKQARKDEEYIASQQQFSAINHSESSSSDDATETKPADWSAPYADKIKELSKEASTLQFALIDLTGSDTPALIADYPGYRVSAFIWTDGSLVTVMEDWPYGAMGNLGYEYLPGRNVIRNYNNDQAGAIVYESYMTVNDAHEVVDLYDETLSFRYFKDTNGNGQIDENEYVEEPLYYYGEKEITEKEYASYQIPGDYKLITGDKSAEAILSQLGVEIKTEASATGELLYKGIPLYSFIGEQKDNVIKKLGAPVNDQWSTLSYDDIYFGYRDATGAIYYIGVRANACEVNGVTLEKNRAGLVGVLGEPLSEVWDEGGEFQRNFIQSNWFISFSFTTDDVNEVASPWIMLWPSNDMENNDSSYEEYQAPDNKINDSFEWVETATGSMDNSFGLAHVKGVVKNTSTKTYSYVQIVFNLYDSSGNQIDTAMATINNLKAGGTWKFDAVAFVSNVSRFEFASIEGF